MDSILNEIKKIRQESTLNLDLSNSNRYRVVVFNSDRTKTAYCFGAPIYNENTLKSVDFKFYNIRDKIIATGSNAMLDFTDKIIMKNREGKCSIFFGAQFTYDNDKSLFCGEKDKVHLTSNGIVYTGYLRNKKGVSFEIETSKKFENALKNSGFYSLIHKKFRPYLTISCIGCFDNNGNVIAPAEITYKQINEHKWKFMITPCVANCNYIKFEINLYEQKNFQDTTVEDSKFIDLYAVKIFDENGYTTTASIICAINWAIENKIDIINMSFGTYYPSKILKKYIDKATEYGIVIVAAVGNDGGFKNRYRIMYPAKYDNVIAVGSGDENGVSIFSNNSIDLDFVAPGTPISIDINGGHANITGTSVSCAYITSVLALIWSINRNISSTELISLAKSSGKVQNANDSYVGYGEIDAGIALTNISTNDKIETSKSNIYSVEMIAAVSDTSYSTAAPKAASYSPYSNCGSTDCICDDFMPSAIQLSLSTLTEISYSQLKQGVWYKFAADELDAHPGVGTGFYYIYTLGQSDTIGELYDSNGNFIASNEGDSTNSWRGFEIYAELEYAKTYYVYVEEKNLVGGSVAIGVNPIEDDYGNCISNATYLGDVYSQNISVSGFLHNTIDYYQNGDLDYFYFRSTKDCVAEIYSEGSSEVYGAIFDANGVAVELNSFDIVNDDFKLTCRIECGKLYYIEISKLSNFDYATHYTLNVKFLKDYCIIPDDFYITNSIVTWYNNSYIPFPTIPVYVSIKYRTFMSKDSATIWRDCYLDDPDFAQNLQSLTSDTLKNFTDIKRFFSSLDIEANAETTLIAAIIASILISLIAPLIDDLMFNYIHDSMENNEFMIAEFLTVGELDGNGTYDSYDLQTYNISSGNYLYGPEYLYGMWERIILLKEPE